MSNSFIGSKIAIITKSQCRYVGTIIGIDAQTSSILLGSVICYGTESRPGNFVASQIAGTVVPIMQFANSDIEDLKIVDEEATLDLPAQQQQQKQQQQKQHQPMPLVASPPPPPPPPPPAPPSIHDDPAIVSAVISSSSDSTQRLPPAPSKTNDVVHAFYQMNLTDHQTTPIAKPQDFRFDSQKAEGKASWPSVPTKAPIAVAKNSSQGNKSRFFDDFSSTNSPSSFQSSNNQSQRTVARDQDRSQFNGNPPDLRSNFGQNSFVNDRPRFPNGHQTNFQRSSHRHYRPNLMSSQVRHPIGRETFQGDVNDFNDEFDFETSNRKFNKIASEDEYKQQNDSSAEPSWQMPSDGHINAEHAPIYDKKKSFFDNISSSETSDGSRTTRHQHRTTNQDTFGYDSYSQRSRNRPMGNNFNRRTGGNTNQYRQGNQSNGYYYHQHQQY